MSYYVWVGGLNSLYDERPGAAVLDCKVNTEEEAKAKVSELQTHDMAAWYQWNDCEDRIGKWDSDNPCLSWLPTGW